MLSSRLMLIISMMGVLNFAHASFYMVGAYMACRIGQYNSFSPALFLAQLRNCTGRSGRLTGDQTPSR